MLLTMNAVCGHCDFVGPETTFDNQTPIAYAPSLFTCPLCRRTLAVVVKPAHDADTN